MGKSQELTCSTELQAGSPLVCEPSNPSYETAPLAAWAEDSIATMRMLQTFMSLYWELCLFKAVRELIRWVWSVLITRRLICEKLTSKCLGYTPRRHLRCQCLSQRQSRPSFTVYHRRVRGEACCDPSFCIVPFFESWYSNCHGLLALVVSYLNFLRWATCRALMTYWLDFNLSFEQRGLVCRPLSQATTPYCNPLLLVSSCLSYSQLHL